MWWTIGRSAGTAIDLTRGADLVASVGQLCSFRRAFRNACRSRRNIPNDPMCLIVGGLIANDVHIVHVEHEALCTCRWICPRYRRRCALAGSRAFGGLTEPNGDLAAIREARDRHRHCRSSRCRSTSTLAARRSSATCATILSEQREREQNHANKNKTCLF